jgi:subtilisin-like proprotein convertase family protein
MGDSRTCAKCIRNGLLEEKGVTYSHRSFTIAARGSTLRWRYHQRLISSFYGVFVNRLRRTFLTAAGYSALPLFEAVEARCLLAGGAIAGVAWNDLNGNGILEPAEPRLAGWAIFLDANDNDRLDPGEVSTITNSDGSYLFSNLAPGNYLIGVVAKSGWKQTFPIASASPQSAPTMKVPDAIAAATARSADLSQYDAAQVDSASGWVVGLTAGNTIGSVAQNTGASSANPTGLLADTYILQFPASMNGTQAAAALGRTAGLSYYYPLVGHQEQGRFVPDDPLFPQQWYLHNTLPDGNHPGADADVISAWDKFQGAGVSVAVVDNGVQYTHPDLAPNYDASNSFDFNDNDPDPMNADGSGDRHGTAVAGILAARGNNGMGISGVAPQVTFSAIRLTDTSTTDEQEAAALSFHARTSNPIDIYNNSWGPDDTGESLDGPGPLTLAAMKDSVTNGRGGKGSIYVWAAGNGRQVDDNVNYDGYANSRYVIATTALDEEGDQAFYAEPGAAIFISASGAGVNPGITTTDLESTPGYDSSDYTDDFGGTSAAAPIVSGVVALMLQANPNLTWRDVKHILADTARKNDRGDSGWSLNGAGHWINDKYGFGAVDAAAAVKAAQTWTNVGAETSVSSGPIVIDKTIPDNDTTGLSSSVKIDRLLRVETVEVVFDASHPYRGDLRMVLTAPDGTQSVLAVPHDDPNADYSQWTFTTNRDWDEVSKGTWTLKVTDESGEDIGMWNSWKLNIYGSAITSEQYVNLPAGVTVGGINFGERPLPGARVSTAGFPSQSGSMRLVFTFDRDVGASITPDDLELKNETSWQIIPVSLTHVDYSSNSHTAIWSFPGYAHGILPDGNYTARLKASQITVAGGGQLDGNGDGVGGDDFFSTFFELKGDANHDRAVNDDDLRAVLSHIGSNSATLEQGDLNYDGKVDFNDFQAMEIAYGHSLPPPVSGVGQAAPLCVAKPAPAASLVPTSLAPLGKPLFSTIPIRRAMDLLDAPVRRG